MNHDEAFLATIIAAPDDDAPRLVYADWLEENGRPERAELIRVQCELARLPKDDPRRPPLYQRDWHLLRERGEEWAGPLREAARGWEYRRGLIEGVTICGDSGARRFLDVASAAFRAAPIRSIRFVTETVYVRKPVALTSLTFAEVYSVGDTRLEALFRLPEMARVRTLDLSDNELDCGAALAVAAAPNLSGLKCLNLSTNWVGDVGARALANSPHLKGLEELNLSGGPDRQADWSAVGSTRPNIGDAGALALANTPYLGGLKNLLLFENGLGEEARQALRARFGDRAQF